MNDTHAYKPKSNPHLKVKTKAFKLSKTKKVPPLYSFGYGCLEYAQLTLLKQNS